VPFDPVRAARASRRRARSACVREQSITVTTPLAQRAL
jgi:hypothetical protein